MILNLHGIDGKANNTNFREIRKIYPDVTVVSPQIDYYNTPPETLIAELMETGKSAELVIGNSFGGFFAYLLCGMLKCKCILTNPCIPPDAYIPDPLQDYQRAYVEEMNKMLSESDINMDDVYVILGINDTVLSPQLTKQTLNPKHLWEVPDDHILCSDEFLSVFRNTVKEIVDFG